MSKEPELAMSDVVESLRRLRKGAALARPTIVSELGDELRSHLVGGQGRQEGTAEEVLYAASSLRRWIGKLSDHERIYAEADFNLAPQHSYPTLTERQESLAAELGCASKTVRRHSVKALETLALLLVTAPGSGAAGERSDQVPEEGENERQDVGTTELCGFWNLFPNARVDVVCSEIPEEERPYFASQSDRNYLRYAKFADLDTLIYTRTSLAQICPAAKARDFAPSEYHDADADNLIVIGGPPWNAKYREFLPQLPFYFEPHELGSDDPLVIPQLGGLRMGPRWSAENHLLEDLAVFTRLTLAQGTTVYLLGGCLTLGVLGAAKLFLQESRGARNADYIRRKIGNDDFVLVTEARRIGGITDMADLKRTSPLLLMSRMNNEPFITVTDNTKRYRGVWK